MITEWRQKFANKEGFIGPIHFERWLEKHKKPNSSWKLYHAAVWDLTERVAHLIPNIDKRGWNDHHIDHIKSIYEGFNTGRAVEEIASLSNLRMLSREDNMRKGKSYSKHA